MNTKPYRKLLNGISLITAIIILCALTSGPSQPEFSSFEPVASTNMVDPFTGSFTYNLPVIDIPGPNGSGYSLSLSYHSGVTPEEEASWVGYGWTLNPGCINRSKRGYPDDWKNVGITTYNKALPSRTATAGAGVNFEIGSFALQGLGINGAIRYNNYKGFGYTAGVGGNFFGVVSLGFSVSDGEGSFSGGVNPMGFLTMAETKKDIAELKSSMVNKSDAQKSDLKAAYVKSKKSDPTTKKMAMSKAVGALNSYFNSSTYSSLCFMPRMSTVLKPYVGTSQKVNVGGIPTPTPFELGASGNFYGVFSEQYNYPVISTSVDGYLYNGYSASSDAMDYFTERNSSLGKYDKFIGIPFPNNDIYIVKGEGIGGSFRAYNKRVGSYKPNSVSSHTYISEVGLELEAGLNIGGGVDVQVGDHILAQSAWSNDDNFADEGSATLDEPNTFRFSNDLGGFVTYGNDNLVSPSMSGSGETRTILPYSSEKTMNQQMRNGRSSYIGYTTNQEMLEYMIAPQSNPADTLYYKSQLHDRKPFLDQVDRSGQLISNQIGEYYVVNQDGSKYIYGLPVYAKNEKNISMNPSSYSNVSHNFIATDVDFSQTHSTYLGSECIVPYASTYLLTSITTPDYIDRKNDGPTPDDFGGYVRFVYKRAYGTDDKSESDNWFKWRMPYTGFNYMKNDMSSAYDDLISYSSGLKEIYYLDSIITKTHIAVFDTLPRYDGYSANESDYSAGANLNVKGDQTLSKLNKIRLYSIGANDSLHLLKTVNFEYDYELCEGVKNSAHTDTGKLTLKKVWFDYNGVCKVKVSPYEFSYEYPAYDYPDKYSDMEDYGNGMTQNPDFSYYISDAWGNYQKENLPRFDSLKTWLDQTPDASFDPAAWQLKAIKLPSGGEIHIQYEQNDYCYVQDMEAHIMASIVSVTNENIFEINTDEYGLTNDEKEETAERINKLYRDQNKRMFFKFLYRLLGNGTPNISDAQCNNEYFSGYVYIDSAYFDDISNTLKIKIINGQAGNNDIPLKVCQDYVNKERVGDLTPTGNCNCSNDIFSETDARKVIERLIGFIGRISEPTETCQEMNPEQSYFRIPYVKNKKGGGVRVKRLLLYDKGIESGLSALYGNEYNYVFYDKLHRKMRSSGVATNEPPLLREENPLVTVLPRDLQPTLDRIIAGRDKTEMEGPLGESILPGPSVGYSRVVVSNIHQGESSPGYTINEFHTVKDFPLEVEYTEMDKDRHYFPMTLGLFNRIIDYNWATQGYIFRMNNMHGQKKSEATYGGTYSYDYSTNTELARGVVKSSQEWEYFGNNEELPVISSLEDLADAYDDGGISHLETMPLGKESDIAMETRKTRDECNDAGLEFDATFSSTPPWIPWFNLWPFLNFARTEVNTAVINKVISYPAVIKSIKSYRDGIYSITQNVAFGSQTGIPVITRTFDSYNELTVYNENDHNGQKLHFSLPALSHYEHFGQMAENQRMKIESDVNEVTLTYYNTVVPKIVYQITDSINMSWRTAHIHEGDRLLVFSDDGGDKIIADVISVSGCVISLDPSYYSDPLEMDSLDGQTVNIDVIISGRKNMLNTNMGTFTIYGADSIVRTDIADYNDRLDDRQGVVDLINNKFSFDILGNYADSIVINGVCGDYSTYKFDADSVLTSDYWEFNVIDGSNNVVASEIIYDANPNFGEFILDSATLSIMYLSSLEFSTPQPVTVFNFCTSVYKKYEAKHVIENSVQTFSDDWTYDPDEFYITANNGQTDYESGEKGRWRSESQWIYKADSMSSDTFAFRSGLYDLPLFNWTVPASNGENWLRTVKTNQYDPHGNAIEEEDILGIKSSAKFGYQGVLPYLTASNSDRKSVFFESFENTYDISTVDYFEDQMPVLPGVQDSLNVHSGYYSLKLGGNDEILLKTGITSGSSLQSKGIIARVWLYTYQNNPASFNGDLKLLLKDDQDAQIISEDFLLEATCGSWSLFSVTIPGSINDLYSVWIDYNTGTDNFYIDDIKFQPVDSKLSTYVYDIYTKNTIAIFDDQHFGLFYQYNAEGKLVRKIKETVRGLKTIQETQYNTPETYEVPAP